MKKTYKCTWCDHEFERIVDYWGDEKKAKGSTQVKCPNCCNFLKTWDREETGNIIGRKHIHNRR